MAENINEALLNRHTLSGPDEESRAAGALRESHAQEMIGEDNAEEEKPQGLTLRQKMSAAKKQAAPEIPSADASAGLKFESSAVLKESWIGLLESFGATLPLINLYAFFHWVFGEKFFCALGEEWIPLDVGAGAEAEALKKMAKKLGLLEKMLLIALDFLALMALLAVLAILVLIGSVVSGHFDIIIKMGWSTVKAIFTMFNSSIQT
jgi:hypothetical protein